MKPPWNWHEYDILNYDNLKVVEIACLGSQYKFPLLCPLRLLWLEWTWKKWNWNERTAMWLLLLVLGHCPWEIIPNVIIILMLHCMACALQKFATWQAYLQTEQHPRLPMVVPCKFGGCIQKWTAQGCGCMKDCYFLNTSIQISIWSSSRYHREDKQAKIPFRDHKSELGLPRPHQFVHRHPPCEVTCIELDGNWRQVATVKKYVYINIFLKSMMMYVYIYWYIPTLHLSLEIAVNLWKHKQMKTWQAKWPQLQLQPPSRSRVCPAVLNWGPWRNMHAEQIARRGWMD